MGSGRRSAGTRYAVCRSGEVGRSARGPEGYGSGCGRCSAWTRASMDAASTRRGPARRQPTAGPGDDASVDRERGAKTTPCGLILIRFIDIARTICYRWKRVKIWEERQSQRVKGQADRRSRRCPTDALAASHACDADSQIGCRLQDRETGHGTTGNGSPRSVAALADVAKNSSSPGQLAGRRHWPGDSLHDEVAGNRFRGAP